MASQQRGLFGGAIVFSIPPKCIDVSCLRPVPDTQEVFVYPDSQISIVVETLQRVPENDREAAMSHFSSLAEDNSATGSSVERVTRVPKGEDDSTLSPIVLQGTQLIPKLNHTTPDTVHILLAVFRIKDKNVDLVLSMNIPLATVEGKLDDAAYQQAQLDFDTAVKSLRILNLGLFA